MLRGCSRTLKTPNSPPLARRLEGRGDRLVLPALKRSRFTASRSSRAEPHGAAAEPDWSRTEPRRSRTGAGREQGAVLEGATKPDTRPGKPNGHPRTPAVKGTTKNSAGVLSRQPRQKIDPLKIRPTNDRRPPQWRKRQYKNCNIDTIS